MVRVSDESEARGRSLIHRIISMVPAPKRRDARALFDELYRHAPPAHVLCPHPMERVAVFRGIPPYGKCLDCGKRVERRWVAT